jgi:hypothetical protein
VEHRGACAYGLSLEAPYSQRMLRKTKDNNAATSRANRTAIVLAPI